MTADWEEALIQPLPWTASRDGMRGHIHDANGFELNSFTRDEAEFICRACNHHEDLLSALREMRDACAAAMRVISDREELVGALNIELAMAGVANGFGTRTNAVLSKAEGR